MEEIAKVYARSLFEVAREHDKLDEVRDQVGEVADAFNENREMASFFFSPSFTTQEKEEALERAVQDADPSVANFLRLLIDNHRMPMIFRIRTELDHLWQEAHKRLPVEITSAIELDDSTIKTLGKKIGERTGQEVELATRVEPDILGGIVVRVGNSILDASIRNRLDQLRKQVSRGSA